MKKKVSALGIGILVCIVCISCASVENVDNTQFTTGVRSPEEYASEWLGLRYTLSEEMVMMDDAYINTVLQTAAAEYGEVFIEGMDYRDLTLMFEFLAVNVLNSDNVSITVEKMYDSEITEAVYAETVKSTYASLYDEVSFFEDSKRTVANIDFYEISLLGTVAGTTFYQMQLYKRIDDRMVSATITCLDQGALDDLLAGFSPY